MPWTFDQKLDALMRLRWSIAVERDEDEGYLIARVAELPDTIATGDNDRELAREMWDSLRASLGARLEHGDPIPLPKGAIVLPWQATENAPTPVEAKVMIIGQQPVEILTRSTATGEKRDLQPAAA